MKLLNISLIVAFQLGLHHVVADVVYCVFGDEACSETFKDLHCEKDGKQGVCTATNTRLDAETGNYFANCTCTPVECKKKNAQGECDPHFKTWTGQRYDFHGECDLVMLHHPGYHNGLGIDVHIRTKIDKFFSYIESVAVKIGSNVLEVSSEPENEYWINGQKGVGLPAALSGQMVTMEKDFKNQNKTVIAVYLGVKDEKLVIKSHKGLLGVYFRDADEKTFSGSLGLLGSFETGLKMARDGTRVIHNPDIFGLEWQVRNSDTKLFQNPSEVQHPKKCVMPKMSAMEGRKLRAGGVTEEEARNACAHVDPDDFDVCIFDVLATNDVDLAGAYKGD